MKLLVAKEKQTGIENLRGILEMESFVIDSVYSFSQAGEKINLFEYDCIVLDNFLSEENIFKILDLVSGLNRNDGLIILSQNLTTEQKVKALDLGADDIVTESVEPVEIVARIRAIIRRKKFQSKSKIYFGNLVVDIFSKIARVWDTELTLTRKEFEILLFLISNKDKIISKTALAEYLWGESANQLDTFDALFTHIKNLRKKLKEAKAEVDFKSVYGVGYQIIEL